MLRQFALPLAALGGLMLNTGALAQGPNQEISAAQSSLESLPGPGADSSNAGAGSSSSPANDCARAASLMAEGVKLSDASLNEENYYRLALAACPAMAEASYNLGVVLIKQNRAEEALKAFESAVHLKDNPAFGVALASAKLRAGRVEEARQEFEALLKTNPQSVKAWQGLSLALERAGKYQEAVEALKRARASDDNDVTTHYDLAVMYERLGNLDAAIASYQRALEIDPQHFEAQYYLGLAYQNSQRWSQAQAALRKASELKPENAEVLNALARAYGHSADWDKAELALRRTLAINPQELSALVNLSIVLVKKKQPSLAKPFVDKALALEPKQGQALGVAGWVELELGNFSQAESRFLSALEQDATDARAHQALAVLYQRQGKKEEAQTHFDAAAQLDPELGRQKKVDWHFWE